MDGRSRAPTRQIITQIFWIKSESTHVCLSGNLSFIAQSCDALRFTPWVSSWMKHRSFKKLINLQLYPSYWLTLSEMRRKMCYFVVFQPSKVEMLNCSYSAPQFWSIWPIFQMAPKLCYINLKKNSENLSRVGALGRRYPCYPNRAKIHRLGMGGQESNRQSLKSQEDKALFQQVKSRVFA